MPRYYKYHTRRYKYRTRRYKYRTRRYKYCIRRYKYCIRRYKYRTRCYKYRTRCYKYCTRCYNYSLLYHASPSLRIVKSGARCNTMPSKSATPPPPFSREGVGGWVQIKFKIEFK